MEIMIFGGDRLGKIPDLLHDHGVEIVRHITGRKQADLRSDIPPKVATVLVLTDYLSHSMLSGIKDSVKRRGVKTVFVRRSWVEISKAMELV